MDTVHNPPWIQECTIFPQDALGISSRTCRPAEPFVFIDFSKRMVPFI